MQAGLSEESNSFKLRHFIRLRLPSWNTPCKCFFNIFCVRRLVSMFLQRFNYRETRLVRLAYLTTFFSGAIIRQQLVLLPYNEQETVGIE